MDCLLQIGAVFLFLHSPNCRYNTTFQINVNVSVFRQCRAHNLTSSHHSASVNSNSNGCGAYQPKKRERERIWITAIDCMVNVFTQYSTPHTV